MTALESEILEALIRLENAATRGATGQRESVLPLVQRVSETSPAETARRLLFECGGDVFFAVRITADNATLSSPKFLGNDSIVLPQTEAASGARYDCGDYERALDLALETAGYAALRDEQRRRR